jgi:acyl carrier protein
MIIKKDNRMEFEKLASIIADTLSVDPEEITMETSFTDDLGADSLDLMDIVVALEDELDISISDEKLPEIKTVGDAYELIRASL